MSGLWARVACWLFGHAVSPRTGRCPLCGKQYPR
jgi:hypothetical protein